MDTLRAFEINDDDLYAARDVEHARSLWSEDTDMPVEEADVRELSDEEMDAQIQDFDEDEQPIPGVFTTIRKMMEERGEPGWFAGRGW